MEWLIFLLQALLLGLLTAPSLALVSKPISARDTTCTPENAAVRKEWGSLTKPERRQYIDAVLCLQKKPSVFPKGLVPGAKNRYDDFTATHINQTRGIHNNGVFLSWHRRYLWIYEKALQEECGYNGTQPYWNWSLWCTDLAGSPIFDGSDTSLSGDGEKSRSTSGTASVFGLPLGGTAGGCITTGPFKNMTTNLGIIDMIYAFTGLPSDWTAYKPNCLLRALNNDIATQFGSQKVVDNLMASPNIATFQDRLSGGSASPQGSHNGGHFAVGPVMANFFSSPSDPVFYLHHGMVDRVWTLWQAMNPGTRQYALSGTSSLFNGRDTPEVTRTTKQNWGYLGGSKTTEELMSAMAGDFCYRYE